ncbi:ATP-dependent RNA helicase RhlE [Nitrosomonas nitrosa]|uniref:DEAD/DEAH box helicase n=1 Tax=Nitrosomonas nitrosa TaxID=52442 RepID=UPI000D4EFD11|nr:DEAD/DEAH box helicase [Nitrosomonas nitrosa]PTQ97490.1 ATP-dependent RNA helicase RhlE [Nitrosomonas nitrosa]
MSVELKTREIPLSTPDFNALGLSEPIRRAITDAGYTTPTPIQLKAIPLVLSGGDLLAGAQTGTGKTAGFTLPILQLLSQKKTAGPAKSCPRCLILTPTRELAAQVEESVKVYGKYLSLTSAVIFGGVNINPQITRLRKPLDILVATPGRLLDHVNQKTLDLTAIEILVLDEADHMLDMGFIHDIKKILALLPKQRQNLLFSATFSDEIKALADKLLRNPGFVEVARRNTTSELVKQTVHLVDQNHKRSLMSHLIKHHDWQQVLVFTRTKHGANRLSEKLLKEGIEAAAIHGNKSQGARTKALAQFKEGSVRVLVATDIAARGLDIDQLPQVVNFELPNIPEDYIHRIGRTGRAGSSGSAISLVAHEEMKYLRDIERLIKHEIPKTTVEGFIIPVEIEPEEARPPRQQRPVTHPNKKARQVGRKTEERTGMHVHSRTENGRSEQHKQNLAQKSKPMGSRPLSGDPQNSPKKQPAKKMSEAARHQAMPQTTWFSQKPSRPSSNRGR